MSLRNVALLCLAIFLSGCQPGNKAGQPEKPLIVSFEDYAENVRKAQNLSLDIVKKYENGGEPNSDERIKLKEAAVIFDGVADYQPTNLIPYLGAAKIYKLLGDYDSSIQRLQQGLTSMPANADNVQKDTAVEANYVLSSDLYMKRDYVNALNAINNAIKNFPRSPIYLAHRASIYGELRQFDLEEKDLRTALQIDPRHEKSLALMKLLRGSQSDAMLKSAMDKLNKKDYKGVIADATKGLSFAIYEPLFVVRAAALIQLHRYGEARKDMKAIEAINPDSPDLKALKSRLK